MDTQRNILEKDLGEIIENLGNQNLAEFKGQTVLITGANGFVGNYLVRFFSHLNENLNYNIKLILIVGPNYRNDYTVKSAKKNIQVLKRDLTKEIKIIPNIDYAFHLASITSPVLISNNPIQSLKVNILGTLNILEALKDKKIKKFLYFSSSAVYGTPDKKNIPIPETFNGNVSPLLSRSSYAEAKRAAESLTQAYFSQYKMPINIVRPFHIYGPMMDLKRDNALNYFLNCGFENRNIILNSNGQETRSFCYISDAISIVLLAVLTDKSGEVFNIGNEKAEVRIIDLAKLVSKIFNNKIKISVNQIQKGNFLKEKFTRNVPNMEKVKKVLKFSPKVNLKTGLIRTVKIYI
jgi:nucleoside-diphosphate-sugar epimerase